MSPEDASSYSFNFWKSGVSSTKVDHLNTISTLYPTISYFIPNCYIFNWTGKSQVWMTMISAGTAEKREPIVKWQNWHKSKCLGSITLVHGLIKSGKIEGSLKIEFFLCAFTGICQWDFCDFKCFFMFSWENMNRNILHIFTGTDSSTSTSSR